jgi:rRNA maturation endonuclease Nob1
MSDYTMREIGLIEGLASRSASTLKDGQTNRWEDDGQGGGRFFNYTPGVTVCDECGHVIDSDGICMDDSEEYNPNWTDSEYYEKWSSWNVCRTLQSS